MASKEEKKDVVEEKLDTLLELTRASCIHIFDCGKLADEFGFNYPSVTFTCTKCKGRIMLYPEDYIKLIKY